MYRHILTQLGFALIYETQAMTIEDGPTQLAQTSAELIDLESLLNRLLSGRASSQRSSRSSIWDLLDDRSPAMSTGSSSSGSAGCDINDVQASWRADVQACSSAPGDYWACRQEANDHFEQEVCECDSRWRVTWNSGNTGYSMSMSSQSQGSCGGSSSTSQSSGSNSSSGQGSQGQSSGLNPISGGGSGLDLSAIFGRGSGSDSDSDSSEEEDQTPAVVTPIVPQPTPTPAPQPTPQPSVETNPTPSLPSSNSGPIQTSCGAITEDWSYVPDLDWSWRPSLDSRAEDEKFQRLQLDRHNFYRARHGSRPLAYDPELARMAQAYAEEMDVTRRFEHDTAELRQYGHGENLAYKWSSRPGAAEEQNTLSTWGLDAWYDEVTELNYFSELARTGQPPSGSGHFTQVVWNDSCKVGCGTAGDYLVCRYEPAGNVRTWGADPYRLYKENVRP